jgi:Flp pilus assembly protein TadG
MTTARSAPRRFDERGSLTVEGAIGFLGLLSLAFLGLAAARIAGAENGISGAAHDAARHASIARNATTARTQALAAARSNLDQQHLHCRTLTITLDTGGFSVPAGQPATVTATVTCVIQLADLSLVPGLPGSLTRTATFVSALDRFRAR